MPYSLSIILLN